MSLLGLTVRERHRGSAGKSLLDRILDVGVEAALEPVSESPDLRGYVEEATRSGFPEPALRLGEEARQAWLGSYLDQLLTRDVLLVDAGRDPERLRRFVTAYAAITAQVVDDTTLIQAAGIDRKTAIAYEQLLRNLFVVDWLPAWSNNLLKQLIRSPKRYMLDPALAAAALRLDAAGIMRRGTLLGPILETFVLSQIRAEVSAAQWSPQLFHLRTHGGRHEVDIIVELEPDRFLGIEVKATAAPRRDDAIHLCWLQQELGDRFEGGIVFHTGPRPFMLSPGIVAAPIAALWG
ncbi:MAG: DUF4143 domain-containing protein [Candidatus Sericytochromatia bacterium]|uniref:DUF4143 domain-containing protein n=1 Tax=Candidatus Tanganyikabacteria bacterium TaxID=2961651 RepID=A0A937X485_9BACT|nr:DUF4143 domain-containing protein [Candidatus Tanganyikabacteria bacterium]